MDSSRSLWVTCAAGGFVQVLKCYEGASLSVANPRRLETENRPPLLVFSKLGENETFKRKEFKQ